MNLLESGEMYLETIYILSQKSSYVRAIDVGEYMSFSKPSVSRALGRLKADNYITVDENGAIRLTDEGLEIAKKIYTRHTVLTKFLIKIGVNEYIAAQDACKMEHDITDETMAAIIKHIDSLE